jgi:hypothetical protein
MAVLERFTSTVAVLNIGESDGHCVRRSRSSFIAVLNPGPTGDDLWILHLFEVVGVAAHNQRCVAFS